MLSLHTIDLMLIALDQELDPKLRKLLEKWVRHTVGSGLESLTHIAAFCPKDTEAELVAEIGLSPLVDPVSGARYNDAEYQPFWDGLTYEDGWWEMVVTVGSSGFAYILLIADAEGVYPELIALCRAYAK